MGRCQADESVLSDKLPVGVNSQTLVLAQANDSPRRNHHYDEETKILPLNMPMGYPESIKSWVHGMWGSVVGDGRT